MVNVVGTLPKLLFYQELSEEQILDKKSTLSKIEILQEKYSNSTITYKERRRLSQTKCILNKDTKYTDDLNSSVSNSLFDNMYSAASVLTLRVNQSKLAFADKSDFDYVSSMSNVTSDTSKKYNLENNNIFANQETTIYMTLYNDYSHRRSSGTQATASINKCLQVYPDRLSKMRYAAKTAVTSDYCSTCTSGTKNSKKQIERNWRSSEVYFWGRKKVLSNDKANNPGMGMVDSKTKINRSGKITTAPVKSIRGTKGSASVQVKSQCSSTGAQIGGPKGASASTSTAKSVSIKDNKLEQPCPTAPGTKEDIVATVTHIRIGPKEQCPIYGKEACQGPKCKAGPASEEGNAPVKVTTVTNPRRGIFELVIRKLTGAPLAKNELMLEWTPPTHPQSCGSPCPAPNLIPSFCRQPKCKMIVCRPVPCKPKFCKRECKIPCGPKPCQTLPCKHCLKSSCCGKICSPCTPCPPVSRYKPCPPCKKPCVPPCSVSPCRVPCKSSPCLRPCPVGRRSPRRARSQPKIGAHRKLISPCRNRSKVCPVVQCRSVPGPCIAYGKFLPCAGLPTKCCSVAPCKSPKYCKSDCSTGC